MCILKCVYSMFTTIIVLPTANLRPFFSFNLSGIMYKTLIWSSESDLAAAIQSLVDTSRILTAACVSFSLCLQMYVNLLFWYQFFCGFSGSVMTNAWVLILFNLVFTSIPPLIYGILDQDTPAETLMELPELYVDVQTSKVTARTQHTTHKPALSKPAIPAAAFQYLH